MLAEHGFSAAIFAPAWTHEHFSTLSNGEIPKAEVVEHAIWEGNNLQYELGCDCREGRPHHTLEYKSNPIVRFARESPAGSFFLLETNFERAFTQHSTSEDQVLFPRIMRKIVIANHEFLSRVGIDSILRLDRKVLCLTYYQCLYQHLKN